MVTRIQVYRRFGIVATPTGVTQVGLCIQCRAEACRIVVCLSAGLFALTRMRTYKFRM